MIREALAFDDVLIQPAFSKILPGQVRISSILTNRIGLPTPIISAAMDTVTESGMVIAMSKMGGTGVIHKNMSVSEQASAVLKAKLEGAVVGAAVGTSDDTIDRASSLVTSGIDYLVIDTAHGHSQRVSDTIKSLRQAFGNNLDLIVGNVATADAARFLCELGVDAVKVGIGPGSICTTRIVAGVGVPQFTAIQDVSSVCDEFNIPVIADGGIRYSGDIVKALAAGASSVMLGSLLAGTDQSPGDIIVQDGYQYKEYRGMGSEKSMNLGSADRYGQSGQKKTAEGVVAKVKYKGSVTDIMEQLIGGIKSGMGYIGASNIAALQRKANFVRITNAGQIESRVHDVVY